MSKGFLCGWQGSTEVMVDPSDVIMNAAGTNMQVATFSESALNRGDRSPEYVNFRTLDFEEKDRNTLEAIFKKNQSKLKNRTKVTVNQTRAIKKIGRDNPVLAVQAN